MDSLRARGHRWIDFAPVVIGERSSRDVELHTEKVGPRLPAWNVLHARHVDKKDDSEW